MTDTDGAPPVDAGVDAAALEVTAVVCAYTERRLDDTVAALASLAAQTRRPEAVLLVVDHHRDLATRLRGLLPVGVRVVENSRARGLSGARNTALDLVRLGAARAGADPRRRVVAFLDDDATARPDWLERLLAPYADPDVVAVGGSALPRWPGGVDGSDGADGADRAPAVLPAELWWVVGCSYPGQAPPSTPARAPGPTAPGEVRNLMGCAMTFRLSGVLAAGDFEEDMGRVGTVPLGCEETEYCLRLRASVPGARILFDPDAVVDHHVSPDRTGWSYLRRRCVAEGESKAVVARRWGTGDGLAAERAYSRRVLPAAFARELRAAGRALRRRDLATARDRLIAGTAVPVALGCAGWGYVRGSTRSRRGPFA